MNIKEKAITLWNSMVQIYRVGFIFTNSMQGTLLR